MRMFIAMSYKGHRDANNWEITSLRTRGSAAPVRTPLAHLSPVFLHNARRNHLLATQEQLIFQRTITVFALLVRT